MAACQYNDRAVRLTMMSGPLPAVSRRLLCLVWLALSACANDRLRPVGECSAALHRGDDLICVSRGNPRIGECRPGKYYCVGDDVDRDHCVGEVLPAAEVCDGLDNDCDGLTDEGIKPADDPLIGIPCGQDQLPADKNGVGSCHYGRTVCRGGVPVCEGVVGPSDEVCDGRDNDCNGLTDEGGAGFKLCWDPANPLVGECRPGLNLCRSGRIDQSVCTGEVRTQPEVCGDGKDNDCDGEIDETCFGLRIKMTWDGPGDIDLHLHNGDTGQSWFGSAGDADCYYGEATPDWDVIGSADDNPRLDVDNTRNSGPENIRIRLPVIGEAYTVGVHNFRDGASRIATVKIYCGTDENVVATFVSRQFAGDAGGNGTGNDFWKAAKIVFTSSSTCTVTELNDWSDGASRCQSF